MLKRISAFVLSCILVFSVLGVSAEKNNAATKKEPSLPEGYTLLEENGGIKLFVDMKTGDFAVLDETVNRVWYSGQHEVLDINNPISQLNFGRIKTDIVSMLALNYVQVSTIASTAVPLYQNTYAYCVTEGNVKVNVITGGYRVEYYFDDLEVTIPVEVILNNGKLKVSIIGNEIKSGDTYRITSIALLPGFLAGDERNDGYLFVPSGSGALVPFATGRGEIVNYSEMVYGDDIAIEQEEYEGEKQKISVPVYGIKSGDSAITAVITSGDSCARISAEADSLSSSFTRVYSEYITSIIDETVLFESNYENQRIIYGAEERTSFSNYSVEYSFLRNEDADYSGMAKIYRDYLNLQKKQIKPSLKLSLYGAAQKKASFLGIPYNKTISLTSFDNAKQIISELNKNDVPVALRYIGWNNNGLDNKKVSSEFEPVSALGGKSGFKELKSFIDKADAEAWFDTDLMLLQKWGNGFSPLFDVCKSIFNTRTPIYEYMRSVFVPFNNRNPHYLLTPANVKKAAENFNKEYEYGGGISLGNIGNSLYSDFRGKKDRSDCVKEFTDILEKTEKENSIALENPNAYTFKYIDTIYDIPMCNDGNLLFCQSVPFIQMVLHGYISYGATKGCDLLDCIEYGADPGFYGIYIDARELIETDYNWLYSSTYKIWKDDAIKLFKEYNSVYSELADCVIVEHSAKDGISETIFDNGTVIYVNRNETECEVNGVTVPSMGYKVMGGGGYEET